MTQTDDALKPCPFCGGKPYLANVAMVGCAYVVCTDCRMQSDDGGKDRVVAAWNRRADLAQPDPMADPRVTALLDALQVYADGCDATETTPCGYDGNMCCMTARTALAAFNTTDKPQGANNEVKGGNDE